LLERPFGRPNTTRRVLPFLPQSSTKPSCRSQSAVNGVQKPSDRQPPLAANLGLISFPLVIGMGEFRVFQVGTANPI